MLLTWVVKISIDESWIVDGFEVTEENVKEAMQYCLPYAYDSEIKTKIMKRPDRKVIDKLQNGPIDEI